jgi:3-hydroxyacyl-CoA dehydrogenase
MTMSIQRADVIGGGIMGSGIGSSLVRQLNKARQQRCAVLGSSTHRWRRGAWDARAAMAFIAMTDGRVAQGYQYG